MNLIWFVGTESVTASVLLFFYSFKPAGQCVRTECQEQEDSSVLTADSFNESWRSVRVDNWHTDRRVFTLLWFTAQRQLKASCLSLLCPVCCLPCGSWSVWMTCLWNTVVACRFHFCLLFLHKCLQDKRVCIYCTCCINWLQRWSCNLEKC